MDDHQEFLHELTTNFGPHDAAADAIQHLENLTMKDSSCIAKYLVEFNHWASQVKDYGKGALCHCFYSGLPDCIKDEVPCVSKPTTLHALHKLAQTLKPSTSSSTPNTNSKKAEAPKSDINHLLGKDGKLTAAGWLHCLTGGLCLFCGEPGHSAKDCPKLTSCTAKACVTKATTPTALPAERSEPKN
ncbi:hypothetical protein M404DRAFT_33007 [Pisolithus tinctorius Marx 270]|uniref:CCHC-type domain-containing protein n=1 Tax=Pisolithus tinctorius Marx 270 TaxID=870435 RepID=A0A0C3N6H8_PISTI|nr:hypothetical protein M404DRAFT_33007 [Pisolithus tinctorius Marx 270]